MLTAACLPNCVCLYAISGGAFYKLHQNTCAVARTHEVDNNTTGTFHSALFQHLQSLSLILCPDCFYILHLQGNVMNATLRR